MTNKNIPSIAKADLDSVAGGLIGPNRVGPIVAANAGLYPLGLGYGGRLSSATLPLWLASANMFGNNNWLQNKQMADALMFAFVAKHMMA